MEQKLYHRERYLQRLRPFYHDDDIIKVITGVRRCGKSCLMATVAEELVDSGVPEKDIIYLDLDSKPYRGIATPNQLEAAIDSVVSDSDPKYLFIDEVQNVDGFESVVNAYRNDGGFSVFLTGSNSYLLSGELATKLTGRYVETEMFTLGFSEHLGMKEFLGFELLTDAQEFEQWLSYGGFPRALRIADPSAKDDYVRDVVDQVFEKDIRAKRKIRNRIAFDRSMIYAINNFGATTNLTNITGYLDNVEHVTVKKQTLAGYLQLLANAKLLYRCPRFDLKSRRSLRGEEKYYLADPAIYRARNTDARVNFGPALENALYTHLLSKGYSVSVGKIGTLECDFIVRKGDNYAYVQVAMTVADPEVERREYAPFGKIRDGWPRYLFTLDSLRNQRDGVRHLNLMEFLKEDGELF